MVRAGQEGGFLEDVLKRISDFAENQEDLKSKVVGALAYPIFLAVVGFILVNVLVIFFVPQFDDLFKTLEKKNVAALLDANVDRNEPFHGVVVGPGVFCGRYRMRSFSLPVVRHATGAATVDGWRLRLPVVGSLYLNFALTRFTRILGTLLHNGIPILQALHIAKDSTGNLVLSQAIEQSAENVTAGDSLAAPLAACKFLPRDVVEMIAVGEESNSLDTVLVDIANGLEKRTSRQLELFVRLLEPMLLLVMAAVIGLVVAGLLLPVFKMGSAIG